MDLILKCISNNPQKRPDVRELERHLAEIMLQFPTSIVNLLELLCPIKAEKGEKQATKTTQMHRNSFKKVAKRELDSLGSCDIEFQMKHLQLQIENLQTQKQVLECEKKVLETERNLAKAETVSLKRQTGKQEEILDDAIMS